MTVYVSKGNDSLIKKMKSESFFQRILGQKRIRSFPMFHNSYVEREAIENANQQEELVPIRIDMELEGQKLRDCFVWNRNERLITPEAFAEAMCDDLKGIFC